MHNSHNYLASFLLFRSTSGMAKKIYYRLVVPVEAKEMIALSREANRLGFKNAHRWAAFKLVDPIRKVTGPQK